MREVLVFILGNTTGLGTVGLAGAGFRVAFTGAALASTKALTGILAIAFSGVFATVFTTLLVVAPAGAFAIGLAGTFAAGFIISFFKFTCFTCFLRGAVFLVTCFEALFVTDLRVATAMGFFALDFKAFFGAGLAICFFATGLGVDFFAGAAFFAGTAFLGIRVFFVGAAIAFLGAGFFAAAFAAGFLVAILLQFFCNLYL